MGRWFCGPLMDPHPRSLPSRGRQAKEPKPVTKTDEVNTPPQPAGLSQMGSSGLHTPSQPPPSRGRSRIQFLASRCQKHRPISLPP